MANIKSAKKRARQAIVKTERNQQAKKAIRTFEKKLRTAVSSKKLDDAKVLLKEYSSKLTKAAQKGMVHSKTASRKIGRLAKLISKSA